MLHNVKGPIEGCGGWQIRKPRQGISIDTSLYLGIDPRKSQAERLKSLANLKYPPVSQLTEGRQLFLLGIDGD